MRVGARAPLTRPIGRDRPPSAGEPVRDVLEVAAAVRDRMQPDDRKSIAAIVVGNRNAVDGDSSTFRTCAKCVSFRLGSRYRRYHTKQPPSILMILILISPNR